MFLLPFNSPSFGGYFELKAKGFSYHAYTNTLSIHTVANLNGMEWRRMCECVCVIKMHNVLCVCFCCCCCVSLWIHFVSQFLNSTTNVDGVNRSTFIHLQCVCDAVIHWYFECYDDLWCAGSACDEFQRFCFEITSCYHICVHAI